MLNQLQKLYPSIISYEQRSRKHHEDYIWFADDQRNIFGIHQKELSEKEIALLTTIFSRYNSLLPKPTEEEVFWYNIIQNNQSTYTSPFRFVYFKMTPDQIEPTAFKSAISELFQKNVPILWENETTGILVEKNSMNEEQMNYAQIIDILMTDLSVHIQFYIGNIQSDTQGVKKYYSTILNGGEMILQLTNKKVITYQQSIPYLLLNQTDEQTKKHLIHSVLKKFERDDEMIRTLEMFLQYNLNVSETAKKMYMHRNSLQYRIDKFINETGINVQKFDEALIIKLALIARNMNSSICIKS